MAMKTFVNLPVKDLAKAMEFFTKLGFSFDLRFTNDSVACMTISDGACAMLQVESAFKGFTQKDVPDPSTGREVIVGLSVDSRTQVDDLADKVLAAGGEVMGAPRDQGFMYMRGFRDLDGHQWSFISMDMSAIARP